MELSLFEFSLRLFWPIYSRTIERQEHQGR